MVDKSLKIIILSQKQFYKNSISAKYLKNEFNISVNNEIGIFEKFYNSLSIIRSWY